MANGLTLSTKSFVVLFSISSSISCSLASALTKEMAKMPNALELIQPSTGHFRSLTDFGVQAKILLHLRLIVLQELFVLLP